MSSTKRSAKASTPNRCWPGYVPVPGKAADEQGSCRRKAESMSSPSEKKFQRKRDRQVMMWNTEHPDSPRKAAQHLHRP